MIKGEILRKGELPLIDGQTDYKYTWFTVMALTVDRQSGKAGYASLHSN